jgi:hypothetical protein
MGNNKKKFFLVNRYANFFIDWTLKEPVNKKK